MSVSWLEVRVLVPVGWHELVAEALALGPCTTVAVGNPSIGQEAPPEGFDFVRTFVPDDADTPALRAELTAALARLGEATGCDELRGLAPRFKRLPPEDYATSWRKSWRPFRVGRLAVVAPWWTGDLRPTDVRLELEPGGAFGSGRHATTRTCLKVLLERVAGGERVLDAGSGSGILAVAAALLGAGRCLGFDVDPTGRRYGEELAARNGVAGRCAFRTGGFETLGPGDEDFDVVLANIYSDVIQEHAAELRARLRPGGWFAFSGCPTQHRDATRTAIGAAGLELAEERRRGRWHTFVGQRPR
jgi:ribosomal protein L11 methyltransferase